MSLLMQPAFTGASLWMIRPRLRPLSLLLTTGHCQCGRSGISIPLPTICKERMTQLSRWRLGLNKSGKTVRTVSSLRRQTHDGGRSVSPPSTACFCRQSWKTQYCVTGTNWLAGRSVTGHRLRVSTLQLGGHTGLAGSSSWSVSTLLRVSSRPSSALCGTDGPRLAAFNPRGFAYSATKRAPQTRSSTIAAVRLHGKPWLAT